MTISPRTISHWALSFENSAFADEPAEHAEHSSAHGGHEPHPPGIEVAYQVINIVLFALLIAFVARKKIRAFFTGREMSFRQALVKADSAKKEAEAKRREILDLMAKLESSNEKTIADARTDAERMKQRLLFEAEGLRGSLRLEAERTAQVELERAKAELRAEMIAQAVSQAKTTLSEKMLEPDQKRLQTEFVEKIQVVRP